MEGMQYAGEFQIKLAEIFSPNGEITNLLTDFQLVEINIFEDIFKSSITGNVIVADTRNIIETIPLMGQERLALKIVTPSFSAKKDIIDFSENHFFIYKITGRQELSSGAQTYQLQFISPEAISNSRKRVSKSYYKQKSNISEIVFDLLAEDKHGIQTSKDVFIEETVGNRAIVLTNSNPYTTINKLLKEAVSKKGSPHYVFFENKNGIHFKTLQSIYEQDISAEYHSGDKGFDEEYTSEDDSGKIAQSLKRILEYSLKSRQDIIVNSTSGVFGGRVIEHNIYSKKFNVKTFNRFSEDANTNSRIDDNVPYSVNVFGKMDEALNDEITNSKIHFIPSSRDKDDNDANFELNGTPTRLYETLLDRQSRFVELFDGISITMTVHGVTNVTVGDMIRVSLPAVGGEGIEDEIYSGLYMIKKLRHTFDQGTRTHAMSMEVVKDGLPKQMESQGEEISKKPPTSRPNLIQ